MEIDSENSVIEWVATKVTGSHSGVLKLREGYVELDEGAIRNGRFVFDMNSIENQDISNEERKLRLERHLKSTDFFDVKRYPTASFQIISATPPRQGLPGEQVFQLSGDLTIRGITHVVDFGATVIMEGGKARARGEILVDRTKYGIKYRSGKIYEGLGDRIIHDEFRIIFNLATK
jgi:polyisoprenoid-binding protein YceI